MIQPQELLEHVPCFGTPNALRRQNQQLETLFLEGTAPPVDAMEVVDRFWQTYDSAPEQMSDSFTRTEIAKLSWCFALERNGRRIIENVNATFALLALIQQSAHRSYLHGLRYSFFYGYKLGSAALALLKSALCQMLAKFDMAKPNDQQWRGVAEIVPAAQSHVMLARKVVDDSIPYSKISQQFNLPQDSPFYSHTRNALVDAIISARRVKQKAKSLFNFLTLEDNLDAIKYAVEQLLLYYQDNDPTHVDNALIGFALQHLGDIRSGNAPHWLGMDKHTQGIFVRWLSIIDIQIFFDRMAADGDRKAFWLAYLDSIEYSRVVVGAEANEQAEHLLDTGRYAALIHGHAEQNALILKIGKLVVVELSGPQNLRYVYDAQSTPFGLNTRAYEISELCHSSARFKQDLKQGWQAEFAALLHNHFGIYRHQSRRSPSIQQRPQRAWQINPAESDLGHAVA